MAKTGPVPTKEVADPRIEEIKKVLENLNISAEYKINLIAEILK